MANAKTTKKEMFTRILALVKDNKEMKKFIEHEIELLDKKKASGSKKAQANKDANLKLANELFVALKEFNKPVTISEFQKESISEVALLSNQKISSLLRTLIADGLVVRTEEKKKAYFSVVDTEVEAVDTDEEIADTEVEAVDTEVEAVDTDEEIADTEVEAVDTDEEIGE